jgi:hypothetical protein
MARELRSIDISNAPELLRLAEEVRASGEACLLRRDREDIAVLTPVVPIVGRRPKRAKTAADRAAFRSAAGSWKDVDTDALIRTIYESRRSSRPAVDL